MEVIFIYARAAIQLVQPKESNTGDKEIRKLKKNYKEENTKAKWKSKRGKSL